MSLLAQVNQPSGILVNGAPQYYFPLDSTPAQPEVTAPAFVAIGSGAIPVGNFTARGNGTDPYPAEMFTLAQSAGTPQWSLGLDNVPTGVGNVGNDLAISRYDDSGGYQGPMLTITRATGNVALATSLSVATDISSNTAGIASALTVGTPALIGGGALEVSGTAGVAQVYDNIYHRPNGGMEVINTTYGPTGVMLTNPTYTPGNTGTYSVTMEITADAAGYAWTNGVALIMGYFSSPFPPFPILSDGFLSCDSLANPTGIVLPTGGGGIINNVYKKDIVAIVTLQQGVAYAAQISSVGGFNLGTTGGIAFYIQPLLA